MEVSVLSAVEVVRGGVVESRHELSVAVCDADGRVVASLGETETVTYFRSAAKPMQALPLVEEGVVDAIDLTPAELALCCASHESEPAHVAAVRSILAKAGADEELLRCGPHPPYSEAEAKVLLRAGREPERVHNNCSGKHAGMLALAIHMGWDPVDYHVDDHPVQRRMRAEIARWTGLPGDAIRTGVDGCGVVCFAAPLVDMATSFARFADAARQGEAPARIVSAMTSHPFMVAGTGRTCTDVMSVASPGVFVKLGAEGVYGGGIVDESLGFVIKVHDGGRRGVEVALVRVLELLGALSEAEVRELSKHARPVVRNTLGEAVAELRPAFAFDPPVPGRA